MRYYIMRFGDISNNLEIVSEHDLKKIYDSDEEFDGIDGISYKEDITELINYGFKPLYSETQLFLNCFVNDKLGLLLYKKIDTIENIWVLRPNSIDATFLNVFYNAFPNGIETNLIDCFKIYTNETK